MRSTVLLGASLFVVSSLVVPASVESQLRPMQPIDWGWFAGDRTVYLRIGAFAFRDQRASLAGMEGDLWQFGDLQAAWRTGRVVLEANGTVYRRFRDRRQFAEPHGGALPPDDEWRGDVGDFRISTIVELTGAGAENIAILKFGTSLPTTDNEVGLERDRTDFHALIGGALTRENWWLGAETGLGIHGTREQELEQSDVWLFMLSAGREIGWLTGTVQLTGHMEGFDGFTIRGTEELMEARVGFQAGTDRWISASFVNGFTRFSPEYGILLSIGMAY